MPPFVKATADEKIVKYYRGLLEAANKKPNVVGETGYHVALFTNCPIADLIRQTLEMVAPEVLK